MRYRPGTQRHPAIRALPPGAVVVSLALWYAAAANDWGGTRPELQIGAIVVIVLLATAIATGGTYLIMRGTAHRTHPGARRRRQVVHADAEVIDPRPAPDARFLPNPPVPIDQGKQGGKFGITISDENTRREIAS